MRTGISITVSPSDRRRLEALVRDRNTPQKHVWRAEIVLLSADGSGTNEIRRRGANWVRWRLIYRDNRRYGAFRKKCRL
jgi:hypothetical protein